MIKLKKADAKKLDDLAGEFNAALEAFQSAVQDILEDWQEQYDDKSEKWQESEAGESAQDRIGTLENLIEDLPEPIDTDFDSLTQ